MIKKIIKILLVIIIISAGSHAFANTTIHLNIKTNNGSLYNQDIAVVPCDSDKNALTPEIATVYCAILQTGHSSVWNWAWAPGAFLDSFDGISGYTSKDRNNNDVYHYWSWSLNGIDGAVGMNQYELKTNDSILLTFIDPVDTTPIVSSGGPLLVSPGPVLSTSELIQKPVFNIKKASKFLTLQQESNGSFGEDIYTDWTAISLASLEDGEQNASSVAKLIKYFNSQKISSNLLTDYERHAMALMSLGLNPYNTNGENYIKKIIDGFDGKQFGDINKDNDDIFALIVLQNSGFTKNEKIISDDINFILGRQKENGSWDESVDLTGAGIEALSPFHENEQVKNALIKAEYFLKKNQKNDGGWNDNVSSTAWALEGIFALGEHQENWIKNGNTPFDYLAINQDTDGGIKNDNIKSKLWETAYAEAALSNKTWSQIMQKFNKPTESENESKDKKEEINNNLEQKQGLTNKIAPKQKETIKTEEFKIPEPVISEPVKKESWFKNLIIKIFNFF